MHQDHKIWSWTLIFCYNSFFISPLETKYFGTAEITQISSGRSGKRKWTRFVQGRLHIPGCQSVVSMKERDSERLTSTWILLPPWRNKRWSKGQVEDSVRGGYMCYFSRVKCRVSSFYCEEPFGPGKYETEISASSEMLPIADKIRSKVKVLHS